MSTQIKFAPIIRVSTEKQAEEKAESLLLQETQIRSYVKSLNGVIPKDCWKYKGQEHATVDEERRLLDQLLEDSARDKFDAVIVCDVSRWGRDTHKSDEALRILHANGIRFFLAAMELSLTNPDHVYMLGSQVQMAQYQAMNQALKSINARIHKARRIGAPTSGGKHSWPWGRTWTEFEEVDPKTGKKILTGKWTVDREKKALINRIAQRYIKGESIPKIARTLGMHHKQLYRTLYDNSGPIWIQSFNNDRLNIHAVVETDVGVLLDPETIEAVHRQRELNKTFHGEQKNFYALTKFIRCAHCGNRLFGNPVGKYLYYNHKTEDKPNCKHTKGIRKEELDNAVLAHLIRTFGDPESFQEAVEKYHLKSEEQDRLLEQKVEVGEAERKYNQREQNIISAIGEGIITKEKAKKQLREIEQGIESCEFRLEQIEKKLKPPPDPKQVNRFGKMAQQVFSSALENPHRIAKMKYKQKRRLIETAFNGVDSTGKPLGVTIHWDEEGKYSVRICGQLGENLLHWGEVMMLNQEVNPGEYVPIEEDYGEQKTIPSGKYQ